MNKNFPDFRKNLYNQVEIAIEREYGTVSVKLILDPKNNRVLFRTVQGEDGWIPLDNLLAGFSWPLARSGPWLSPLKFFKPVSDEEGQEIYEKTTLLKDVNNHLVPKIHEPHWITRNEENPLEIYGECSECGFKQSISDKLNFCPNCGEKMYNR